MVNIFMVHGVAHRHELFPIIDELLIRYTPENVVISETLYETDQLFPFVLKLGSIWVPRVIQYEKGLK